MGEDTLQDLKQFIAATITQQTNDLRAGITEIKDTVKGLKLDVTDLRQEMHDGFSGVAEAIEQVHKDKEDQDEKYGTVDQRVAKLEQQTA